MLEAGQGPSSSILPAAVATLSTAIVAVLSALSSIAGYGSFLYQQDPLVTVVVEQYLKQ
jgi:hypothetical protein